MFCIGDEQFEQPLIMGTGKFASESQMLAALQASGCEMATLAIKRLQPQHPQSNLAASLQAAGIRLLPNTSGARTASEAVDIALIARDLLDCSRIKLEIHPDSRYLLPDPRATLEAAERLVKLGFQVYPYCSPDPMLCWQLQELGCAAVMPLASPIGSNQGIGSPGLLTIIIEQARVPVIVDAGLGSPADACLALQMGATAVMVNSAISGSSDPVRMAKAFALACQAGVEGRSAGLASPSSQAQASSPIEPVLSQLLAAL